MRDLLSRTKIDASILAADIVEEYRRAAKASTRTLLERALHVSGAKHAALFSTGLELARALDTQTPVTGLPRIVETPVTVNTAELPPIKKSLIKLSVLNGLHARTNRPIAGDIQGLMFLHALLTATQPLKPAVPPHLRGEAKDLATTGVTGLIYRDIDKLDFALTPQHATAELARLSAQQKKQPAQVQARARELLTLFDAGFGSGAAAVFTPNLEQNKPLLLPTLTVLANAAPPRRPRKAKVVQLVPGSGNNKLSA